MGLKFSKATDEEHEIKLDSYLISSTWISRSAPAGGKAKFYVVTAFVGNGAKIKATGKTSGGETLGKVSSTIINNAFIGEFDIPADAEIGQMAHFEVELSANGLSGESGRIPIRPQINVVNLRWSAKEARRGDVLKLHADVQGCADKTEAKVTIFEYDSDGVHDKIVELPVEVKESKIELEWEQIRKWGEETAIKFNIKSEEDILRIIND